MSKRSTRELLIEDIGKDILSLCHIKPKICNTPAPSYDCSFIDDYGRLMMRQIDCICIANFRYPDIIRLRSESDRDEDKAYLFYCQLGDRIRYVLLDAEYIDNEYITKALSSIGAEFGSELLLARYINKVGIIRRLIDNNHILCVPDTKGFYTNERGITVYWEGPTTMNLIMDCCYKEKSPWEKD